MIFIADGTKRLTRCKEDASKKLLVLESFKCFICQEIFNNSKLLHEHLKSVHNHERFWCEQCNTFYESKELLEEHITKSHELTCKRCLLKCDSVDSYIEHVPIHDDDPLPFKCRFCGRGIKYAYYLKEHTNVRTNSICSVVDLRVQVNRRLAGETALIMCQRDVSESIPFFILKVHL